MDQKKGWVISRLSESNWTYLILYCVGGQGHRTVGMRRVSKALRPKGQSHTIPGGRLDEHTGRASAVQEGRQRLARALQSRAGPRPGWQRKGRALCGEGLSVFQLESLKMMVIDRELSFRR